MNYFKKIVLFTGIITNSWRKSVSDYIRSHNSDAKSPRSSQLGNA